uniref:Acyl-coenzyme A thioesterase 8 n=1 Tax=Sarcophilus harrisii TaxID=9305 RepID=G3VGH0_SARHA
LPRDLASSPSVSGESPWRLLGPAGAGARAARAPPLPFVSLVSLVSRSFEGGSRPARWRWGAREPPRPPLRLRGFPWRLPDSGRGRHYWVPTSKRLFGGQIVGQALVAAAKSVSEDVHVHSLHCYFVRAGDPKVPVLYQVERTRTGASFSVRSVKAVQHGKAIFICQASFQQAQPSPVQHQFSMPPIPPPEELLTHEELIDKCIRDPELRKKYQIGLNRIAAQEVPVEIKLVDLPILGQQKAKQMFWVRARGYIGEGDMKMHCCVAAYISDYAFLGTAMLPHQHRHQVRFMVSLDHSMWFHAPFRADHWMLYECESPWAGGSRGLVHGRLWRRDGVLAVTCAQEGVIRLKQELESKL